ncbi:MAG: hypothetical protein JNN20_11465 [Betaproteobacteria bacterium]|nr:hypothetical protein [Betaproteobacteria bacterium]
MNLSSNIVHRAWLLFCAAATIRPMMRVKLRVVHQFGIHVPQGETPALERLPSHFCPTDRTSA